MALSNLQLNPPVRAGGARRGRHRRNRRGRTPSSSASGASGRRSARSTRRRPRRSRSTPSSGSSTASAAARVATRIKLHMQLTRGRLPAAMEALARRFGVPIPAPAARRAGAGRSDAPRDLEAVLETAAEFFTAAARPGARRPALSRGAQDPGRARERYRLGYAPDGWRNLLRRCIRRSPWRTCSTPGWWRVRKVAASRTTAFATA